MRMEFKLPRLLAFLMILQACGAGFDSDTPVTASNKNQALDWVKANMSDQDFRRFVKDIDATEQGRQPWGRTASRMVSDELAIEPPPPPAPVPTEDPVAKCSRIKALLDNAISFRPLGTRANGDRSSIWFHIVNTSGKEKDITHFEFIPRFVDEGGSVVLGGPTTSAFSNDDKIGSGMPDDIHIDVPVDADGYFSDPEKFRTLRFDGVTMTEVDWGPFDRVSRDC